MDEGRDEGSGVPRRAARAKGRPKVAEGEGIEQAILAATIEVLLDRGEATTINDVAKASGFSRRTIYTRYANRSDLILEAVRHLLARSRIVRVPEQGTAQERLFGYFQAALDIVATSQSRAIQRLLTFNPSFVGSLQDELADSSERQFVAPLVKFFRSATRQGELGVADPQAAAGIIAKFILAESLMANSVSLGPEGNKWRRKRAKVLTRFFLNGLGANPASHRGKGITEPFGETR